MADNGKTMTSDAVDTARKATNKAKTAVNDVKATKKLASQLASQNYAGAATTALKNPATVLKIVAVLLVVVFIPMMFGTVFLILMPMAIITSVGENIEKFFNTTTAVTNAMGIQVINLLNDCRIFLTTGEFGNSFSRFTQEYNAAREADEQGYAQYVGTSNIYVAVLNEFYKYSYDTYAATLAKIDANKAQKEKYEEVVNSGKYPRVEKEAPVYSPPAEQIYDDWTFLLISAASYVASRDELTMESMVDNMFTIAKTTPPNLLWVTNAIPSISEREEEVFVYATGPGADYDEFYSPTEPGTGCFKKETQKYAVVSTTYSVNPNPEYKDNLFSGDILFFPKVDDEKEDLGDSDYLISTRTYVEDAATDLSRLYHETLGSVVSSQAFSKSIAQFMASEYYQPFSVSSIAGPCDGWQGKITERTHGPGGCPRNCHGGSHLGTDISVGYNNPLLAGGEGVVVACTNIYPDMGAHNNSLASVDETSMASYGNYVLVYYGQIGGEDRYAMYAHMASAPDWHMGDKISLGTVLGQCGSTGRVSGAHLHVECFIGNATSRYNADEFFS